MNPGDKVKRLTLLNIVKGTTSKTRVWLCKCECGIELTKTEGCLVSGRFTGCNCHLFINEIGKKYNYIYIKSYNNLEKRYLCICDCGKELKKRKFEIYSMISCGCKKSKDYTGRKIGRLTYIAKTNLGWKCLCDCGKHTTINDYRTESCGCLLKECSKVNIQKAIKKVIDSSDGLANIRKQFKKVYSDGDLSFEDFLELSQKDCFYCGSKPKNIKRKSSRSTNDFYYNGIDRVDNSIGHYKSNSVPCCWSCNRFKSFFSKESFFEWVKNIYPRTLQLVFTINIDIKQKKHYLDNYADGDLSYNDFLDYSQLNCHYCGCSPSNLKKGYYWNGIDRIDSAKNHIKGNLVTCCKRCNFAKSNLSIEEFYKHIEKIKVYNHL